MGKYISFYETTADFETVRESLETPHVCLTQDDMQVHYLPYVPQLIAKYTVTDDSEPTKLYDYYVEEGDEENWTRAVDFFDKITIDGNVVSPASLDAASGMYQFSVGRHIVKYKLKDPTYFSTIFSGCEQLTSLILVPTVTTIEVYAFADSGLESINIPDSVTSIGQNAFSSCTSLTSCTIGSGVTSIGVQAFRDCSGLTSIDIPDSVTSIGQSAFRECTSLTSCTIGSGITSISNYAFYGCRGLTSIVIPDSVTSIGNYAFAGCTNLSSVTIPSGVTSIGQNAFQNCRGLTSIVIPDSVTSISANALRDCSGLTSIICNATTAPTIQNSTFRSVKTGGTLTVPSGSSGYDTWMQNANYYLGLYNWTKVEQ